MNKKILVVGSVNIDQTIFTNELPSLGKTLHGESFIKGRVNIYQLAPHRAGKAVIVQPKRVNARTVGVNDQPDVGTKRAVGLPRCGVGILFGEQIEDIAPVDDLFHVTSFLYQRQAPADRRLPSYG